jgi:excisionase family DNA binding protein
MMALAIPAPHPDSRTAAADPAASRNRALYRVPEVMRLLSLSRSMVYNQIRAGRLRSVKEGNTRLIPADAIADYVALLKAEAEADR